MGTAMVHTALHSGVPDAEPDTDLPALAGLFLTALLVMFRFKLTENLHNDSFSKTTHKVLAFTSKQTQHRSRFLHPWQKRKLCRTH